MNTDTPGITYLLHFDKKYHHAQHYLGWTNDLPKRLREHKNGKRERCVLTHVIKNAGIKFVVVRTWDGPLAVEKKLKRRKNNRKLCPLCNPNVQTYTCRYGTAQKFESEGDLYEGITGRRSPTIDATTEINDNG